MSTTDGHNILKEGSLLWKFARINGFSAVERFWSVGDSYDSFNLAFSNYDRQATVMFGCRDELRPVSTHVTVEFKLDNDDDINDLSNDKIFDLIANLVKKDNLNLCIGKHTVWKKDISREEMLVKMDLWEASMGDENRH